jgi:hypothetical protein
MAQLTESLKKYHVCLMLAPLPTGLSGRNVGIEKTRFGNLKPKKKRNGSGRKYRIRIVESANEGFRPFICIKVKF